MRRLLLAVTTCLVVVGCQGGQQPEPLSPTVAPTGAPTGSPTAAPTGAPTGSPTVAPTGMPTGVPIVALPGRLLRRPPLHLSLMLRSGGAGIGDAEPKSPSSLITTAISRKHFIEWTPDGKNLLFNHSGAIMMVDAGGARLRTIVDMIPRDKVPYYVDAEDLQKAMRGLHADISPDGSQVVYSSCEIVDSYLPDLVGEITTIGLESAPSERLTNDNYLLDVYPMWSPDGTRIAFVAEAEPRSYPALSIMSADGSDASRPHIQSGIRVALYPPSWSASGEHHGLSRDGSGRKRTMGEAKTLSLHGSERRIGGLGHQDRRDDGTGRMAPQCRGARRSRSGWREANGLRCHAGFVSVA